MKINGIEGLTVAQVQDEVARGARFVIFSYCVSALIITFKRPSEIFYLRPGESPLGKALPYIAISAVAGWWGFPFGLIYTPWAIIEDLSGGKDVTREILAAMKVPIPTPAAAGMPPSTGAPLTPR